VSVLRASCDSTEGRKSIRKGAVASLEILLHTIYYPSLHRKIFIRRQNNFLFPPPISLEIPSGAS